MEYVVGARIHCLTAAYYHIGAKIGKQFMQTVAGSNSYKTDRLFDINRSVVISCSFGSRLVGSLALSVMLCPFVLITHVFYF